ncbi:3-dehydroquinate dehydratase [Acinetobacter marinus]|uniref:3-dehydroquinate dehydratase n=2 Tax=Acinetobacter marinus TaxID=281375 RepID=A0A1G6NKH5_9GAMM|nr:3-dehydroquinate dehydratase [Acinetobacter marinus]
MKINRFAKNLAFSALFLSATAMSFAAESTQGTAPHYTVKNVHIGQLPVKTIVPITAKTADQAIAQAKVIAANADVDLAEFRIDLLDFAADSKKVIALGQELNAILKDKPLIATIRTHNEGGKLTVTDKEYEKIYREYLKKPFMQLLDIEMFRDAKTVDSLTKLAHQHNVLVIMSNHDFDKTPAQQEIENRLLKQDQMGADILKIAVMPKSKQDVYILMNATLNVSEKSKKPLLTMSMGQLGTISRIATANMGGSMSFGMIGEASAPGQIDVMQLKQFLKTVQPSP